MSMDRPQSPSSWTEEAITALWREHRGWVAALLYAHMPHQAHGVDVHDLLQEVAVSLVTNIHKLNAPEKIGPWLRTVAMNVVRDAGRRRQVRKNTIYAGEHLDSIQARERHFEEANDAKERGDRALEIIHSLSPEYREPLLLNLRGLSHKQIADVLETPLSTIETRIFRARVMVRREMEESGRHVAGAGRDINMKFTVAKVSGK
jgi:RNA polymerase sigma-70 factor, ECF subfamily